MDTHCGAFFTLFGYMLLFNSFFQTDVFCVALFSVFQTVVVLATHTCCLIIQTRRLYTLCAVAVRPMLQEELLFSCVRVYDVVSVVWVCLGYLKMRFLL